MKRFGFLNGCYWMLLDTLEEVIENIEPLFLISNEDYIIDSLIAGKVIAINSAGGYHAGNLKDYSQHIVQNSDEYPTALDRVAILRDELDKEIDELCQKVGMTRDEVMSYQKDTAAA